MKSIIMCSKFLAAVFLMLCQVISSAQQPTDPWKETVVVDIVNKPLPEALSVLLDRMEISYTFCSQESWPSVTAHFSDVPVDVALKQMLQAAKVFYRVEGNSVLIARDRKDFPVQSVKLQTVTSVSFVATGKKTSKITMDTTNTGAEGSSMAIQSTSGGSVFEKTETIPIIYTMGAQLVPSLIDNSGQSPVKQLSLTGEMNLNLQIPYFDTVSTVVGEKVVNQKVPRFLNSTKTFSVAMALPLDTPTIVAEQTESTSTGKTIYTVTVTASLSKDAVVMSPAGQPGLRNRMGGSGFGMSGGFSGSSYGGTVTGSGSF